MSRHRRRRMSDAELGERIIEYISRFGLIDKVFVEKKGNVICWQANATEQLGAFVRDVLGLVEQVPEP